jgi:hypothetical protein
MKSTVTWKSMIPRLWHGQGNKGLYEIEQRSSSAHRITLDGIPVPPFFTQTLSEGKREAERYDRDEVKS